MKNWETLEPDITKLMTKHYTPGRAGQQIGMVVMHHNAGILTVEDCWQTWQTRESSAHYQVENSGRIGQLVYDKDTAWHAGDWDANTQSIGIEVSNCGGAAEGWPISEKALLNAAHLAAAICKHYKLGEPVAGKNIRFHKEFYSTACPGQLAPGGRLNGRFMAECKRFYKEMMGVTAPKHLNPDYQRLTFEQLAGPGRTPQGKPDFTGWKQLGGHTVVDALAVIGQTLGIPGFGIEKS